MDNLKTRNGYGATLTDIPEYRNQAYFYFSVMVIIVMIPISINNLAQDRFVMACVSSAVALVYIANVMIIRLWGMSGIKPVFTIIPVMIALPVTINQMGVIGVFWTFPGAVIIAFILPSRTALLMNFVLLALVSPFIFLHLSPTGASRAFITLGITMILIRIFAKLIESQHEEQMRLIVTDQLTGAYNRFRLEGELDAALELNRRHGRRTAAIVFDIDHFKRLNDERGHLAGDEALKEVVGVMRKRLRVSDMIFR